ncbi:MAG: zinc ribbon domain-containing protein, partial [Clostridia bacterium]|nr:zinc ribbon domain-containing protein [Clostridia bacterium]
MKCPKCGVKLTAHVKFCSSCGERIERFKEIPNATEKEFVAVRMKKSFLSFWHKQDLFCKIETVAITAASLLLVVSFFSKKVLPIVFYILQLGGLIAALLMHKKKIKCTRDWLQFLVLIIAIAVTVPNISSYSWFEKTGAGAQNSEKHTKVETPCSAVDC